MENTKICHCDFCVEFRGSRYISMGFYESLEYLGMKELKEFAELKAKIILRNPHKEWKEMLDQQINAIQFRIWFLKTQVLHWELNELRAMEAERQAKLCKRG